MPDTGIQTTGAGTSYEHPCIIMGMTTVNDFLTVQEAAAEYRVSTQTVYRFISSGRLPTAQWGRQYRINRRSLEALVAMDRSEP